VRELVSGSAPGTAAPSERDLVERFGVARMTVRQALDALVAEGVLQRFPGRGTFVAPPRRRPSRIVGFTEDMVGRGTLVESRTLVAEKVKAPGGVARALQLTPREQVLRWRRLRFADGSPVCISDAYISGSLVPGLFDGPDLPDSLYDELTARGRRPSWAEDSLSAGVCTPDEAALLECPEGSVVIRLTRRALWEDRPIEISRSVYRADGHTVSFQLGG
jgi:GntR family transcriptional regulator